MPHVLRMFMWGYQPHFRRLLQNTIERLLHLAGANINVSAVLVGVLRPGGPIAAQRAGQSGWPVCIEPERDLLRESDFNGILEEIETRIPNHPNQQIMFMHGHLMDEKPENIRRMVTYEVIRERLQTSDAQHRTISLLGSGAILGQYHVFPIFRFRQSDLNQYLVLNNTRTPHEKLPRAFIEALVYEVLGDATAALRHPDPGRSPLNGLRRDEADTLRSAAKWFMYVAELAGGNIQGHGTLFDNCNVISSLTYENSAGNGRMIIARDAHPSVTPQLKLKQPIRLREAGWARKVLQVASHEFALLCDSAEIRGLGRLEPTYDAANEDAFVVRFVGHYKWELVHGGQVLMRVEYGVPKPLKKALEEAFFKGEARRILKPSDSVDVEELWRVVSAATEQQHGTMVVVTSNAKDEALRLAMQATLIEPTKLTEDNIRRVTSIDGAVLLDQSGVCHAIGVILDGRASNNGTPSRGARYNSAVRYIESTDGPVLAVVVSEDRQIDFLPRLHPQIPRTTISDLLTAGEQAVSASDWEQLEDIIVLLSKLRFYIQQGQIHKANSQLERLLSRPRDPHEIVLQYPRFEHDPKLDDSYFLE